MTTNILILSRDTSAAGWQQLFSGSGQNTDAIASVEAAASMLAAGSTQVLVVDVVFAGDALQALHHSCIDFDVEIVLAVDGVPGAVHYERALSLSALGVISSSDSGAAVQKLLERLQMRACLELQEGLCREQEEQIAALSARVAAEGGADGDDAAPATPLTKAAAKAAEKEHAAEAKQLQTKLEAALQAQVWKQRSETPLASREHSALRNPLAQLRDSFLSKL